jgi:hypothetical protein
MTSLQRRSRADGAHLIAGAFVNVFFLVTLVFFTYLREQPLFWTNAGNWPVWLRELVGASFYPLLLLELCLLTIFSVACIRRLSFGHRTTTVVVASLPFLWMLLMLVLLLVGANNVENLMAGQPLHWHPQ